MSLRPFPIAARALLATLAMLLASAAQAGAATASACADYDAYAPAREAIADLQRILTPDGVQESYALQVGGIEQWINVRGQDRANPLILFVHGGPAAPLTPSLWQFQRPFEEFFTIAHWDQRGAGRTFARNDHSALGDSVRIDRYVADLIDVAEHLRARYAQPKLILIGHSWGTVPALTAAIRHPELFHAYVGIGQIINLRENERLSYAYAVEQARVHGNAGALDELQSIFPYPGDEPLTRERLIIARRWAQHYGGMSAYRNESPYYFLGPRLSPDYDDADRCAINAGNRFTLGRLLPELFEVDFNPVERIELPVLMVLGRHDQTTPSAPTARWLERVQAPSKHAAWFEHSSHMAPWEEPGRLLLTLLEHVRPLATARAAATESER
jgi:pimeloyl-ACP methyl ester carboxylesterase